MSALPSFTTARLLIRPFTREDADAVERLAGDRAVADTTLHIPHPYPKGAAAVWIAQHEKAWGAGEELTLAISPIVAPRDLLGAITLRLNREHGWAELGYWLGADFWNQGYATEAAGALVDYAFGTLGMNRVQAHHFVRNPASGRVMQKLGMREEGVLRQAFRRWGQFEDVALYSVLASERPRT